MTLTKLKLLAPEMLFERIDPADFKITKADREKEINILEIQAEGYMNVALKHEKDGSVSHKISNSADKPAGNIAGKISNQLL